MKRIEMRRKLKPDPFQKKSFFVGAEREDGWVKMGNGSFMKSTKNAFAHGKETIV